MRIRMCALAGTNNEHDAFLHVGVVEPGKCIWKDVHMLLLWEWTTVVEPERTTCFQKLSAMGSQRRICMGGEYIWQFGGCATVL